MSSLRRSYLDWNASAPLRPAAFSAMQAALSAQANPSSVHHEGREARRRVEGARAALARLVGLRSGRIVFTSGGTEANATALQPGVRGPDGAARDILIVCAIEHLSVHQSSRFVSDRVRIVPVLPSGLVDLSALEQTLAACASSGMGAPLVSVGCANGETGSVQPIRHVAEMVHRAGGLLHVDAVQAVGRIALDMEALGADLLTVSGHKIGGPQGVGALAIREGIELVPLIGGGGQERGWRSGTENVAGICGFGAAAEEALAELPRMAEVGRLRDTLEAELRRIGPAAVFFGADAPRLPNTSHFAVPGIAAETALMALDLDGVAVSSGSACSSGKVGTSHVLAAMGVPAELARCAIRVSLGATTTEDDIAAFLKGWRTLAERLCKGSTGLAA